MKEITIDMSSPVTHIPESPCKLLSDKNSKTLDMTSLKTEIMMMADESTEDSQSTSSYQQECRVQILPKVNRNLVYTEEILAHLRRQEEKFRIGTKTTGSDQQKSKHSITAELRAKMVDWIIEVTNKAECTTQTLFLAVGVMDRFLENTIQSYKSSDMHLIGVVSMLLASKFEDVTGMDIPFMYEQVVHKKISVKEMVDFELKILNGIGYSVTAPTETDFLDVYTQILSDQEFSDLEDQANHIAMLNLHSAKISAIKPSLRAVGTLLLTIQSAKESRIDGNDLTQKLCRMSGYSKADIDTAYATIESHQKNFKKLYPKLKNAMLYSSE